MAPIIQISYYQLAAAERGRKKKRVPLAVVTLVTSDCHSCVETSGDYRILSSRQRAYFTTGSTTAHYVTAIWHHQSLVTASKPFSPSKTTIYGFLLVFFCLRAAGNYQLSVSATCVLFTAEQKALKTSHGSFHKRSRLPLNKPLK